MKQTFMRYWQQCAKALLGLLMLGVLGGATAADQTPEQFLQSNIEAALKAVVADQNVANSKNKVYEIVREKILPLFDIERITARSVGRDWLNATDDQKKALVENFSDILMLNYSNAFVGRSKEAKKLTITWGRVDTEAKRALVRSTINTPSGNHELDYSLRMTKDGWKLDDILVNNLSIFNAYRDQFSSIIKNNGGIEGLVKSLIDDRAKMAK